MTQTMFWRHLGAAGAVTHTYGTLCYPGLALTAEARAAVRKTIAAHKRDEVA